MNTKVYRRNITFRVRTINKRNILFGGSKCFELNQLALMIWNELNGENTFDEIVCKISREYDVDKDIASKDAKNFISEMVGKGVILEGE